MQLILGIVVALIGLIVTGYYIISASMARNIGGGGFSTSLWVLIAGVIIIFIGVALIQG